jgi:poly-gamma-glutamate capsule biosynthesis protein CapA/YwtB (metallophosphatase superfamily)
VKLALAGDTMLGRNVGERLMQDPTHELFAPELLDVIAEADLFVLNLECCVSARGEPAPGRVFHFRAPPWAAEALARLGVNCVTLANNHALDFGADALLDTLAHLDAAGIRAVGAGTDVELARKPVVLDGLAVVGVGGQTPGYAARAQSPRIAQPHQRARRPARLTPFPEADAVLVSPHWGPNMTTRPLAYVRTAADALLRAGATLVAGHSAHVFHAISSRVLYDLGDFLDDYAVDPKLRNDLGLLYLVDLDGDRLEAVPLKLEFTHTRLATGDDAAWIGRRLKRASAAFGVEVTAVDGRLVARWR